MMGSCRSHAAFALEFGEPGGSVKPDMQLNDIKKTAINATLVASIVKYDEEFTTLPAAKRPARVATIGVSYAGGAAGCLDYRSDVTLRDADFSRIEDAIAEIEAASRR